MSSRMHATKLRCFVQAFGFLERRWTREKRLLREKSLVAIRRSMRMGSLMKRHNSLQSLMPLRLLQFNLKKFLNASNLFVPFYLVCCNAFCILDFIYCLYICYFVSSLYLLGILFHCFIHLRFCFIALLACGFFIFYFVLSLYLCMICFTALFTCDFISSIYSHLWLIGPDSSLFWESMQDFKQTRIVPR